MDHSTEFQPGGIAKERLFKMTDVLELSYGVFHFFVCTTRDPQIDLL